jgi:hypothetical protein
VSIRRLTSTALVSLCALGAGLAWRSAPASAAIPTIAEESVLNVTSSAATLAAKIDPEGAETTYSFEYGTSAFYGSRIPSSPAPLGSSGIVAEGVEVRPQDLSTSTLYHYRVVATNATGTEYGRDQTFTTQQAGAVFALPDGRMWELVSPSNKAGGEVYTLQMVYGGDLQAAEDGSAITYITSVPVGTGGQSSPFVSQSISKRGSEGWPTEDPDTTHNRASGSEFQNLEGGLFHFGEIAEYQIFSPDLSRAWVQPEGYAQEPGSPPALHTNRGARNDYVRNNSTGLFTPTELSNIQWYEEQVALARGAKFTHESSFGAAGAGSGEFASPQNAAVQQPSGDLFVADGGNSRVQIFDPKGKYLTEITGAEVPGGSLKEVGGVAVDNSSSIPWGENEEGDPSASPGDVYVVVPSAGVVDKFKPKGAEPQEGYEYVCQIVGPAGGCVKEGASAFKRPSTVAVDGLGNVYVGQREGPVEEFDSTGAFVATLGPTIPGTVGVAVNVSGTAVYVATEAGAVTKLSVGFASRKVEGEVPLAGEGATAVAVDPATGDLFLDRGTNGVREYEEDATDKPGEPPLAEFAAGEIAHGSLGIAYGRFNNVRTVYVTEAGGRVLIYALGLSKACDPNSSPAEGKGVDAVSQDGCYVYFNEGGAGALEVAHYDGTKWTATPVVKQAAEAIQWQPTGEVGSTLRFELSPNGRYVAFMSNGSPTGYDNRDAVTGAPDQEVYLYDAVTNRLVCTSCNPTGARPVGVFDPAGGYSGPLLVDRVNEWGGSTLAGSLPDWTMSGQTHVMYQPRFVFNDGMLFFNSPDTLVPHAVNGQENVYEYGPEGVGGCGKAAGCVSLISSGASKQESAFADASASGNDVFFITSSRLVSLDYDNSNDIYDAHLCTASVPCRPEPPVSRPPCETGDSCKAPPTPQPGIFGPPPSATFVGAGNAAQPAPVTTPKSLTRKQKLAAALKACKKKRGKKRRSCESQARRRYGTKSTRAAAVRSLSKTGPRNTVGG